MTTYTGIYNDGSEHTMTIMIIYDQKTSYLTDTYIDGERFDTVINENSIEIDGVKFNYHIKQDDKEIIIAAKEVGWCPRLFRCCMSYKFFVVSNIESV